MRIYTPVRCSSPFTSCCAWSHTRIYGAQLLHHSPDNKSDWSSQISQTEASPSQILLALFSALANGLFARWTCIINRDESACFEILNTFHGSVYACMGAIHLPTRASLAPVETTRPARRRRDTVCCRQGGWIDVTNPCLILRTACLCASDFVKASVCVCVWRVRCMPP